MKNIAITNNKNSVNGRDFEAYTFDEFLTKASEEGIDSDVRLYVDCTNLSEDFFGIIEDNFPDVRYYTFDDEVSSFMEKALDRIELWERNDQIDQEPNNEENSAANEEIDNFLDSFSDDDNKDDKEEQEDYRITELLNEYMTPDSEDIKLEEFEEDSKEAAIIAFGSAKGGVGKTFTCLISAYRFAKMHPNLRVAICDFDIVNGQIGVTIHAPRANNMYGFYKQYENGNRRFKTMKEYRVNVNFFPKNVDFYLAPRNTFINNDEFWNQVFINLVGNYDVVFFDTGIEYTHIRPISTIYKVCDKLILLSTTSIKSVSSVLNQISILTGNIPNNAYSADDNIANKMYLVLTQIDMRDDMNKTVFNNFKSRIPVVATFGQINLDIQQAEYKKRWNIFDNKDKFNAALDEICNIDLENINN